ncbi:MAG: MazG nucleotide pyrophosphohydrolase domain-containing protein [Streptosporangiaceae bacterium]
MQPLFHARIAAERGDGTGYTIDDVADGIVAKLVRRHPHVFRDVTVSGADEVKQNWDEIKRKERADRGERTGAGRGRGRRPRPPWTACRSASPPWRWPRS